MLTVAARVWMQGCAETAPPSVVHGPIVYTYTPVMPNEDDARAADPADATSPATPSRPPTPSSPAEAAGPAIAASPANAADIAGLTLFAALDGEELAALAEMSRLERRAAGTVVFKEGDTSPDLYFVLEGCVALGTRVPGRGESNFLTLGPGDLMGWTALLRARRVATARVTASAQLLRIPASDLLELCERNHRVGYAVMTQAFEELAGRLQDTRLQLIDIFGAPPR